LKKFTLTLNIKGKKKKFRAPNTVSTATLMRTLKFDEEFDKKDKIALLIEDVSPFICDVFGWQFTEEDIQRSLSPIQMLETANELIQHVIVVMDLRTEGEVVPIDHKNKRA
jgi:hypothetical protein